MGNYTTKNKLDTRDYLAVDPPISGQNKVLISFMTDKNDKPIAFKVRVVLPESVTLDGIETISKVYVDLDQKYNVYAAQMGIWTPFRDDDFNMMNSIAKDAGSMPLQEPDDTKEPHDQEEAKPV